jgi:hypothetical protein
LDGYYLKFLFLPPPPPPLLSCPSICLVSRGFFSIVGRCPLVLSGFSDFSANATWLCSLPFLKLSADHQSGRSFNTKTDVKIASDMWIRTPGSGVEGVEKVRVQIYFDCYMQLYPPFLSYLHPTPILSFSEGELCLRIGSCVRSLACDCRQNRDRARGVGQCISRFN